MYPAFRLSIFLFILFVSASIPVSAQIGIGTAAPDNSAVLDLSSTGRGLLPPRMSGIQMNAIVSPATGLILYNTDSSAYCVYTGGAWVRVITVTGATATGYILQSDASGHASWTDPKNISTDTLNIIADTDANTSVIAGTNAVDDKIHYTLGGKEYFTMNKGTLEWNNTGGSLYAGNGSGMSDPFTGLNYNVGLGANTLQYAATLTEDNVAVGRRSLQSLTGFSYANTAVGYDALRLSTGGLNNAAFGAEALSGNGTGSNNTALGTGAGSTAGGSNNLFLGYNAGYAETGSNKLYIANSATAIPLIYGDFSGKTITVNDALSSKYFRMSNGAATGFVLQSDAAGNATWADPKNIAIDTFSIIADADRNTSVTAGTSSTDDKIHFTLANTEYFTMTKGVLEWNNTGGSIYAGNASGQSDPLTNSGYNVGIGANTLQNAGAAITENVAIGRRVLQALNTNAFQNTAVGTDAMKNAASGHQNAALGYFALGTNTAGSSNTALGAGAGLYSSGSGNVFLGSFAGDFEPGSNKLYIANSGTINPLLYGDFSNKSLTVNDSLTSKFYRMTNGAASGYILQSDAVGNAAWASPTWTQTGNNQFSSLSGNVGIGTTNPSYKLHVVATGNETFFGSGSSTGGSWLRLENTSAGGTVWSQISTGSGNGEGAGKFLIRDNAAVRMTIQSSNGNIGIGTTSPVSSLEIAGAVGMKVVTGQVAGTNNPDASASFWIYSSGSGAITLPAPGNATNRTYTIVNSTGGSRAISSYKDLGGNAQSTIGAGQSLWLVSDGAAWYELK